MKILILGLNFAPELIGIGRFTGEMATFLAKSGLEVRVIAAPPYYPEWSIRPGYSRWRYKRERIDGVQVIRCPLWVPARPSNLKRILHLMSFAISSLPVALAQVFWKPDVVLCVVPALSAAPAALLAARLAGARAWLHIQDFELDAAFGLGMLPGQRLLQPLGLGLERLMLRGFDRVSTISDAMAARAVQKGAAPGRVVLFPNWVDTERIHPLDGFSPLRAELGISAESIVVLYHGNMGRKQGLEMLVDAAACLKDDPRIVFVLCGQGATRADLEARAAGLPNVRFLDLQPEEKLNALVNMADIHVLPQLPGAADLVMPSKLTSMLASGRAIIACAEPHTQLGKVVAQAGCLIPPGAVQQLCDSIRELTDGPAERTRLGRLARTFAIQHMDRQRVLNEFRESLVQLAKH